MGEEEQIHGDITGLIITVGDWPSIPCQFLRGLMKYPQNF